MTITNVIVGFAFQSVLAADLGLSARADAFQLAWAVVTFGATSVLSLVPSFVVPRLYRRGSDVLHVSHSVLPIALGAIFTIAQFLGASSMASSDERTILMISAPACLLAALTAVPQALAYAQHRFALAALGPIANGIALFLVTFAHGSSPTTSMLGLALLAGYVAQLLATALPFVASPPKMAWHGNSLPMSAFIGISAFTLVAKIQPVIERGAAGWAAPHATAGLGLGQKVAQGLLLLSSFGLATVATASLSRKIASGELEDAAGLVARTITAAVAISCLIVAGAIPLAWLGVKILFGHGSFGDSDVSYVSQIVIVQGAWVVANAIAGTLTTYLYAEGQYRRVAVSAVLGIVSMVAVTVGFRWIDARLAVPIGSSTGAVASCAWSAHLMRKSRIATNLRTALRPFIPLHAASVSLAFVTVASYVIVRQWNDESSLMAACVPVGIAVLGIASMLTRRHMRFLLTRTFGASF